MGAALWRMFEPPIPEEGGEPAKRARVAEDEIGRVLPGVEVTVCGAHTGIDMEVPAEHDPRLHCAQLWLEFEDNLDPSTGRHIHRVTFPLSHGAVGVLPEGHTGVTLPESVSAELKTFLWHTCQQGPDPKSLHLVFEGVATCTGQDHPVRVCAHAVPRPGGEFRVWYSVHSPLGFTLTCPGLVAAETPGMEAALAEARAELIPGVAPILETGFNPGEENGAHFPPLNVGTGSRPRWLCRGVYTFGVHHGVHSDQGDLAAAVREAGPGLPISPNTILNFKGHGIDLLSFPVTMDGFCASSGKLWPPTQILLLLLDVFGGRQAAQVFPKVYISTGVNPAMFSSALWYACFPDGTDLGLWGIDALMGFIGSVSHIKLSAHIMRRLLERAMRAYPTGRSVFEFVYNEQTLLSTAIALENGPVAWALLELGAGLQDGGKRPFREFLTREHFDHLLNPGVTSFSTQTFMACIAHAHTLSDVFFDTDRKTTSIFGLFRGNWPEPPECVVAAARAWGRKQVRWTPLRSAWIEAVAMALPHNAK